MLQFPPVVTHTHFPFWCGNLPDANHLHGYLSFQLGIQRTVSLSREKKNKTKPKKEKETKPK